MLVTVTARQHISGISKRTGKPFDNNIAHILRPDKDAEGRVGDTVWLNIDKYPLDKILLNTDYNLEYDSKGYVLIFEPVTK